MDFPCVQCPEVIRVIPSLVRERISCPSCGFRQDVPDRVQTAVDEGQDTPAPAKRAPSPTKPPPVAPTPRAPRPAVRPGSYTMPLFLAQVLVALLGAACLGGAFFRDVLQPPAWSFLGYPPVAMLGAAIAFFIAAYSVRGKPVLVTLFVLLAVLGACGWRYHAAGAVDASRVLALAVAGLALWFALGHRRLATPR